MTNSVRETIQISMLLLHIKSAGTKYSTQIIIRVIII